VGFDEFWERPRVRELFRWEISGFVIGIFGPIGVAFLLAESHYVGAYLAFAISGFWALCCWPTLGAHIKRRKRGDVKETPKNRALLQEDRRRYLGFKWGIESLIAMVVVTCFFGTYHYQLLQQRQDVDNNFHGRPELLFAGTEIEQIMFIAENRGHADLGYVHVVCDVKSLLTSRYWEMKPGFRVDGADSFSTGIPKGGAQTFRCFNHMLSIPGSVTCADIVFTVEFSLTDQPEQEMTKYFEYSTVPSSSGLDWVPQLLNDAGGDYCKG